MTVGLAVDLGSGLCWGGGGLVHRTLFVTNIFDLKIHWCQVHAKCHYFLLCSTWLELCINLTLGLLQTEHLTKWQPVESDIDWVCMFSLQVCPTDIVPTHAAKSKLFS